jgi:hypothetical protein
MSVETCSLPTIKKSELDFKSEFYVRHFADLRNRGIPAKEAAEAVYGTIAQDLPKVFLERFTKERLVHFNYRFEGEMLVSSGYEHFGDITEKYEEAICERIRDGMPFCREKAECEGVFRIKEELRNSDVPKTFLLISPPPPPEELHLYNGRYGNESFYFFGRYLPDTQIVDMFAWRTSKTFEKEQEEGRLLSAGSDDFVHPNDLLRSAFFREGTSFDVFSEAVGDMPTEGDFSTAKGETYDKYKEGLDRLSRMLSGLIAGGADTGTLLKAQLKIEMEFTKWIVDGKVEQSEFPEHLLDRRNHQEFSSQVMRQFAGFVTKYNTAQFACGSCGGSVMSMFRSANFGMALTFPVLMRPFIMEFSAPMEVTCPKCGTSVIKGSGKCSNKDCDFTKNDYDTMIRIA